MGEWKSGAEGVTVCYGFHPSPFGSALVMATERGLCGLAFADYGEEKVALTDMRSRWPKASYAEDSARLRSEMSLSKPCNRLGPSGFIESSTHNLPRPGISSSKSASCGICGLFLMMNS